MFIAKSMIGTYGGIVRVESAPDQGGDLHRLVPGRHVD
jgi:hypothetical protein